MSTGPKGNADMKHQFGHQIVGRILPRALVIQEIRELDKTSRTGLCLTFYVFLFLTFLTQTAIAQSPVNLGTAANYAVLAGSSIANTGGTTLCGSLGLEPGTSITDEAQIVINCGGVTDVSDSSASTAQSDLTTAYNQAAALTGAVTLSDSSVDIGGTTLTPGVYYTGTTPVSYTHLRAHETGRNLVCRL